MSDEKMPAFHAWIPKTGENTPLFGVDRTVIPPRDLRPNAPVYPTPREQAIELLKALGQMPCEDTIALVVAAFDTASYYR
jgi:hypothetical protein